MTPPKYKPTYLRLSVTDRCDLRCVYCRPSGECRATAGSEPLSVGEIATLVRAFAANGVSKVRITGGEPLLRKDIIEIAETVARTPGITSVGLTTNGIRLPALAGRLAESGVQHLNISLDSLRLQTYRRITGSSRLRDALDGLREALNCGFQCVKTNTVVMRGINDCEVISIASLAKDLPIEARFIELMPLGHITSQWKALYISAEELRGILYRSNPLPITASQAARSYGIDGYLGRIGIISPVSQPFCGSCNRVRITSRGLLLPCLRSPASMDIRPLLSLRDPTQAVADALRWCQLNKQSTSYARFDPLQVSAMSAVGG